MTATRNEHRPLDERKAPEDMSLPELVREYASLKVDGVRSTGYAGREHHARLRFVVDELRLRGGLD
jgi:hypothetical protein